MGRCLNFICLVFLFKGVYSLEYKLVSQSSVYDKTRATAEVSAALAVDGDENTFTVTQAGDSEYWKIVFPQKKTISCFSLILGKGSYRVTVNSTDISFNIHCDEFNVSGLLRERIETCCQQQINGDSFAITRTDYGLLRLYEVNISAYNGHKIETSRVSDSLVKRLEIEASSAVSSDDAGNELDRVVRLRKDKTVNPCVRGGQERIVRQWTHLNSSCLHAIGCYGIDPA